MSESLVRPAILTDAERIATIAVRTWQCAYNGHIPDDYLDKLSIEEKIPTWENKILHPHPNTYTLVIEKAGQVVGWCTCGKSRDEDRPDFGQIYGLYIDNNYLGQGLGTELISQVVLFLKEKGYSKFILWVLTSNQNARNFYEKNGWKSDGKTQIDHYDGLELDETRYMLE
jgi:ribosomal protein S18 acetylase RimI-like enzyme